MIRTSTSATTKAPPAACCNAGCPCPAAWFKCQVHQHGEFLHESVAAARYRIRGFRRITERSDRRRPCRFRASPRLPPLRLIEIPPLRPVFPRQIHAVSVKVRLPARVRVQGWKPPLKRPNHRLHGRLHAVPAAYHALPGGNQAVLNGDEAVPAMANALLFPAQALPDRAQAALPRVRPCPRRRRLFPCTCPPETGRATLRCFDREVLPRSGIRCSTHRLEFHQPLSLRSRGSIRPFSTLTLFCRPIAGRPATRLHIEPLHRALRDRAFGRKIAVFQRRVICSDTHCAEK